MPPLSKMIPGDLTSFFNKCQCHPADQTTLDLLPPEQPAIYAFYDAFRFHGDKLLASVDVYATKHARVLKLDDEGMPEKATLIFRGSPKRFGGRQLVKNVKAEDHQDFNDLLMFLSILNEPRYIGETVNVKKRFLAHHNSDFLYRMKEDYGRSPSEFLFFYIACPKSFVKLAEKVLIHLISPAGNIKDSQMRAFR